MIRKTEDSVTCWSVDVSMKRLEGPDLFKGEIDSYSDRRSTRGIATERSVRKET